MKMNQPIECRNQLRQACRLSRVGYFLGRASRARQGRAGRGGESVAILLMARSQARHPPVFKKREMYQFSIRESLDGRQARSPRTIQSNVSNLNTFILFHPTEGTRALKVPSTRGIPMAGGAGPVESRSKSAKCNQLPAN